MMEGHAAATAAVSNVTCGAKSKRRVRGARKTEGEHTSAGLRGKKGNKENKNDILWP